jgi:hypothetical protein
MADKIRSGSLTQRHPPRNVSSPATAGLRRESHGSPITWEISHESLRHNGSPFGGTLVSAQWRVTLHIQLLTTINQLTMLPSPVPVKLFFFHWRIFAQKQKIENDVILEGF